MIVSGLSIFSKEIVRINRDDFHKVSSMFKFIDVAGRANDQTVDIVMDEDQINTLKNSGIKYVIVERKFYKDVYPTTAQVYDSITKLATNFPQLVDVETVGTTYNNRPIVIMKINGKNPDTCLVRYQFFLVANHHAREWQTISTSLFFVDSILRAYNTNSSIKRLIDSTFIVVLPMLNPDGYYYSRDQNNELWRKNRTLRNSVYGVDLNRNYPGQVNGDIRGEWGAIYNSSTTHYPSSDVYCGPYSASEREVQSLMNIIKRFSFNISISLHSYSELVLYPYGATSDTAPDNTLLSSLATKIASKMTKQTSGTYTPEKSDALYPTSGDSDGWIYGYTKFVKGLTTLPFTFEIDTGFSPPTTTLAQLHRRVFPGILYSAFLCESVYGLPKEVPLKPSLISTGNKITWNLKNSNKADYYKVEVYDSVYTYRDSLNGSVDSIISSDYKTFRIELSKTSPYSAPYSFRPLKKDTTISSLEFFDRFLVQNNTDSLTFYMSYDLETNYDKAFLEYSYDGFYYEPLDTINGIFTGTNTTWRRYSYPLSRFLNKEISIRLKTVYDDATINTNGVKVDNIYPITTSKTRTVLYPSNTDTFISTSDTLRYYIVTPHNNTVGFTKKSDRFFFYTLRSIIKDSLPEPKDDGTLSINFSNRILTINNLSNSTKHLKINIFDITGRKVFYKNFKVERHIDFDLNFLNSGKYFLVVDGDKTFKEGLLILK